VNLMLLARLSEADGSGRRGYGQIVNFLSGSAKRLGYEAFLTAW